MKKLNEMNEKELRDFMIAMGREVEDAADDFGAGKPMFILLMFEQGTQGQYISNCSREGICEVLRATADRLERNDGKEIKG